MNLQMHYNTTLVAVVTVDMSTWKSRKIC